MHWIIDGADMIKSDKAKVLNVESKRDKQKYVDFDIKKQIIGNLGHTAGLNDSDKDENGLIKFKAIVLHRTETDLAVYVFGKYTNKNQTGAHFLIDTDGTIYQTETLDKYTLHIGNIRPRAKIENTWDKEEEKYINSLGWKPKTISDYEKQKSYPNRYPINTESIGIEVVGRYNQNTQEYQKPTAKQLESLERLVIILLKLYNMSKTDIYAHGQIAYKDKKKIEGVYLLEYLGDKL